MGAEGAVGGRSAGGGGGGKGSGGGQAGAGGAQGNAKGPGGKGTLAKGSAVGGAKGAGLVRKGDGKGRPPTAPRGASCERVQASLPDHSARLHSWRSAPEWDCSRQLPRAGIGGNRAAPAQCRVGRSARLLPQELARQVEKEAKNTYKIK